MESFFGAETSRKSKRQATNWENIFEAYNAFIELIHPVIKNP